MMKKKLKQQSINDYLDLEQREWIVEFEIGDFGASFANLFELPAKIYRIQSKNCFWNFLKVFLQDGEISFILRKYDPNDSNSDRVELALLGSFENKQFAIPLWIMKDLLLGFEIIPSKGYIILNSKPLMWSPTHLTDFNSSHNKESGLIVLSDDFFQGQKIYFKLKRGQIMPTRYFNELEFFDRIARTKIPEIDEFNE
ncbi:MAG: hypothetical protein ACFFB5_02775 [Promethearchaeota archaeon]